MERMGLPSILGFLVVHGIAFTNYRRVRTYLCSGASPLVRARPLVELAPINPTEIEVFRICAATKKAGA